MSNVVSITTKKQADKFLKKHDDLLEKKDIRQTVQNSLKKLNDVESRIDKLENKGFFKRLIGSISGQNSREMIAAMRDIGQVQQLTIQLVLSLAIMHSQNQSTLDEILDELGASKGTYTRIAEHIDFLYNQVEVVKKSNKNLHGNITGVKRNMKKAVLIVIVIIVVLLSLVAFFFKEYIFSLNLF